jgi:ferredoxin
MAGMSLRRFAHSDLQRYRALAGECVVPDGSRCVQCGICAFNCPVGIDVRSYARRNLPVTREPCIRCGECVARCPRCVLELRPLPGTFGEEG